MAGPARPGRRRRRRPRPRRRPAGVRLRAGLHRVRRLALRDQRREDRARSWTWRCSIGAPIVGLNDSGGARIQEGVLSLGGYADIFLRNTLASGVVPQISAIMGPCAGGAVYSPAITDFIVMVEGHELHVRDRPDVIKTVTHEDVTKEELGGAMTHNATSGVAHFAVDERPRVPRAHPRAARRSCPSNNLDDPPRVATERPGRPRGRRARHARAGRRRTSRTTCSTSSTPSSDDGYFLEVHRHYAQNIIVGFARLGGRPVGIVANQPAAPGRHPRHRRVGEGRALRALLRRVQHPARDLRGRARLPAGHRAGVRRHHPARREAALRLRRGDGAEGDRHHAQGLRRRLLRHVEQAHPHRLQLRVADGRDRGDGTRGRGQHPLPARARGGRRRRRRARAEKIAEFREKFANPYVAAVARLHRRGHPAARRRGGSSSPRSRPARTSATTNPPKKHGNIPL